MKRSVICLALLSSVAVSTNGFACGDKMVQIGRGLRYQRANAVRPATIVMFIGSHFNRDSATRLQSQLTVVGHRITIVDDRDAFVTTLASKRFDMVLTDVDNLALVSQRVDGLSSRPTIVPMIDHPSNAALEIRSRFPFVMLLSSRGLDQIALISRIMK